MCWLCGSFLYLFYLNLCDTEQFCNVYIVACKLKKDLTAKLNDFRHQWYKAKFMYIEHRVPVTSWLSLLMVFLLRYLCMEKLPCFFLILLLCVIISCAIT